jgi:hypothetical protein
VKVPTPGWKYRGPEQAERCQQPRTKKFVLQKDLKSRVPAQRLMRSIQRAPADARKSGRWRYLGHDRHNAWQTGEPGIVFIDRIS